MDFINKLNVSQKCLISFIVLASIITILLKYKESYYYSPLYTGIGLNKPFAIRSENTPVVDLNKAATKVKDIETEQGDIFKDDPFAVSLQNHPTIINERDNPQSYPDFKREEKYRGMFMKVKKTEPANLTSLL